MIDIQTALLSASKQLAQTSDSAELDAEVLLSHVLNKNRSHLRAWPEKFLQEQEQQRFLKLINDRHQGEPIAYLIGYREFWSRDFKVTRDVLIPRPDTELIIELCLNLLKNKPNARILDLGTGSGIIAVTLAAELPEIEAVATDFSLAALTIAKHNALTYQLDNITFIQSNWFDNIPQSTFDLVISNPPYIAKNDPHLSRGDLRFEPHNALISDNQGLKDIKTICHQARLYSAQNSTLLIEHGYDQKKPVQALFNAYSYSSISTHSDLSNNPRVTTGQYLS